MEIEAILLVQTPTGERTNRLSFLAPTEGHITVFKKVGKSLSRNAQPDIFDTATLHIQTSKDGKYHHLGSYHPTIRRSQIATKYNHFKAASQLASFTNANAQWIEDSTATYRLLEKSLDAFNEYHVSPNVILLKTFYALFQQEGYPVRQDWRMNLSPEYREEISQILHHPLADLEGGSFNSSDTLLDKLLSWARHHTSFHF